MIKINTDLPTFIYSWTVSELIDLINEVKEDAELSWDSWGGSTGSGQKFVDFLNNREHKLNANVAGYVASMGTVMLPFFNHVKGAKQADVMIHALEGGVKSTRKHTNEFLYKALAKKINEAKFKEITGHELKTVMLAEDEDRVDVWFTGEDAEKMGLFDETYDLLDKAASFKTVDFKDISYDVPENIKNKYTKQAKIVKSNNNEMEITEVKQADLKSGNPSVYNAIIEEGKKAEQTRVAGIMKYAKYDMDKANELIEKGATLSVENVEHFMEKKFNKTTLTNLENNSVEDLKPGKEATKLETEKTDEAKEKDAALDVIREQMGTSDLLEETKK